MSTTQLAIANMAIDMCAGDVIEDIPDGNKLEGLLIDRNWQQCLETVLGEHDWCYFRTWVELTEDTGYTFIDDTYTYAYEKPSDWARLDEQENRELDFTIRANRILSNIDDMEIAYIAIPTIAAIDTTLYWPAYFNNALAANIAMIINPKLNKKGARGKDFEKAYLAALQLAMMRDANEDREAAERLTRHGSGTDSWINARGGE